MSIPTPPDLVRGKVSWTVGRTDGTTLPGVRGTVRFEATAVAVTYSTATVLPSPVETPVVDGTMTPVDLLVNDPEVWNWRVTPRVGVTWDPFHIDVDGPVDLATAAVVPGVGPVRAVKGEKGDTPTWGDLPGKPTTFPPAAHSHAVADVTGLPARLAALERDTGWRVIDLFGDVTAGRLIMRRVGDRVTARWSGIILVPGSGRALFSIVPASFVADTVNVLGLCVANNSWAEKHFVQVETNGLSWIGTVGVTHYTRPAGPLEGELSWLTDSSFPATFPGTPA